MAVLVLLYAFACSETAMYWPELRQEQAVRLPRQSLVTLVAELVMISEAQKA